MTTDYKVTELFCIIDEFCKHFDAENAGNLLEDIIETINDMLKNTAQIVHSRHRSVSNFIMNLISALGAYCFFDNKPKAFKDTASKTRSNFHCSKDRIISFDSLYIAHA